MSGQMGGWRRIAMVTALAASVGSDVLALEASGPDVMLQGFYWDVPSPAAGNADAPWWWEHLGAQAKDLGESGFSAIWLPPVLKGASGPYSVGYDPFDDYDMGSKDQKGTVPLRYGTREQLQQCVAQLRAGGLDVLVDLVLNHRNGDDGAFLFRYKDAAGNHGGGRFPKGPADFHPNAPPDPNVYDRFTQFGRDVAHINGASIGDGLKASTDWMTRALGIQGYRLDFVKGFSCDWMKDFLQEGERKGKFAVAEFWDEDEKAVADYVEGAMGKTMTAFDFPLRALLARMCSDEPFDMRLLHRGGYMGRDASRAVTFVDNHDTFREHPIPNKLLAYAMILTSEGLPCVFYADYSTDPGCLGLKDDIDRLIWIRKNLARGETRERWKSDNVFCFERQGGPRLLVALNRSPDEETITPATGFGPGVTLRDYAGHAPDLVTGQDGVVQMTIPGNQGGRGYVCYSVTGAEEQDFSRSYAVTQEFQGAADLDIPPADPAGPVQVARIRAEEGTSVNVSLASVAGQWNEDTRLTLQVLNGEELPLATANLDRTSSSAEVAFTAPEAQWLTLVVLAESPPVSDPRPSYTVRVTYTGPLE